jgi:hypothetical protein
MSINSKGVHFDRPKIKRGVVLLSVVIGLEAIFSFFLYLSLAGRIFSPNPAYSASGVPALLSYQGRLTDTSGNNLGGTGTTYCFRYSIYDATSTGSKLWPASTPNNSTTTVKDGIFSDQIGRMDTLTYDFFSTSTVYLNVDVNTATTTCGGSWESMLPRQQITASGFSLSSQSVYGSALRTTTSTKVQVGTGGGVPSGQTLLSLDQKNSADTIGGSCTDNGSLWYNSANTKALVCENSIIQQISNPTSTIAGIKEQGAASPISSGTVNFSGQQGVTISQNGQTLQFSAGIMASRAQLIPTGQISSSAMANGNASFRYFVLENPVSFSRVDVPIVVSLSSSATANTADLNISSGIVIYSRNASTLSPIMGSFGTTTYTWASGTSNFSSLTGGKFASFALGGSLPAGEYWIGFQLSTTNNSSIGTATTQLANSISVLHGSVYSLSGFGNFGNTFSASTNFLMNGMFTNTITATNQTIALSNISMTGTQGARAYFPFQMRNW